MTEKRPVGKKWDSESPLCQQIFCAAVQGLCANPEFLKTHDIEGVVLAADRIVIQAVYREDI